MFRSMCFCDTAYGMYGKGDLPCNVTCLGNQDQICGGTLLNSIYKTKLSKD